MQDTGYRRAIRTSTILFAALALMLSLSAAAWAEAPPPPEPAHGLPGDALAAPAAGNQTDPFIVSGGAGFLAVWADARSSLAEPDGTGGTGRDIYAARLDADGQLIDTTPIAITRAPADQYDPRAVWNGEDWLVLWTGSEPYVSYQTHFVEGARLSADGLLLDTTPMELWPEGSIADDYKGGASDGQDWALVFQQTYIQGLGTKERLIGRRVTAGGALLNAPSALYSPSCCSFFWYTGMAYADGVYMLVFEGYFDSWDYGIFGLRLNGNLQTLDSYPLELVHTRWADDLYYSNPNVGSNGSQFYVSWQHWDYGTDGSQVLGARVDPSGSSLDGEGVPISNPLAHKFDGMPAIAWDGGQWVVGWPESDWKLARIGVDGTVLDPGGVAFPGLQNPALAEASSGVQALWSESRWGGALPMDVFTARIASDLNLGADACVSLGAPAQRQADAALGSASALLVYRSESSADARVKALLLDRRGNALMTEPMDLAPDLVGAPAVAFNGSCYLVAWGDAESGEVRARRVDESGELLDPVAFSVLAGSDPDLSALGGQFLVSVAAAAGAKAARVSGDGMVLDTPPLLLEASASGHASVGTLGSSHWLAAWEALGLQDGSEIHGALVFPDGTVAGPLPITAAGDGIAPLRPAVASGDTALVLWQDDRAGSDDLNLFGRRLAAVNLQFLDTDVGLQLTDAPGNQSEAAVAWDGRRFLSDFSDDRAQVDALDGRLQTYRGWVEASGAPVENPGGLPLLGSESATTLDAALAADSDGNSFYLASVFDASAPYAAYRLQIRYAGEPTGVESTPAARQRLAVYPNPANPSVQIRFSLASAGRASVGIYDLRGRRVSHLEPGLLPAGNQELHWDGRGEDGRELASGIYLIRLRAAGESQTAKVTLLR